MGKPGHSVLLIVVDCYSRLTLIKKSDHKENQNVNQGLVELLGALPKESIHSLTSDHGRGFLNLNAIKERLGVAVYWPAPY
ncbi:hypothetical protein NX824_03995 [Limosilactobacillus vaginalis]|nr:hypothetical protein NX824_03995 [Limosilactobacillus vaginalis]